MAYQTSMVKDLAIALEALSRVNTEGSPELYSAVAYLLQQAIDKTRKEFKLSAKGTDDEIPF